MRTGVCLALMCLTPWFRSTASAQDRTSRTVVAVHVGAPVFTDNRERDAAIRDVLLSRADLSVDYFAEYLEIDRFPYEQS